MLFERKDGKTYRLDNFKPINNHQPLQLSRKQRKKRIGQMRKNLRKQQLVDEFDSPMSILVFDVDKEKKTCNYCLCPIKLSLLEKFTTEITPSALHLINWNSSRVINDEVTVWIENEKYILEEYIQSPVIVNCSLTVHRDELLGMSVSQALRWTNQSPNKINRIPVVIGTD